LVDSANCSQNHFGYNAYYSGGKHLLKVIPFSIAAFGIAPGDVNGIFANPYVDANGYTTQTSWA
jgi:hypothetical protein